VLLPATASNAQQYRKRVAVLEFSNVVKLSDFELRTLADDVRGVALALRQDGYDLMTRENMLAMIDPQKFQQACSEGQCEVEAGRKVGADLVISGEVGLFGGNLVVLIKLFDTASASLLGQEKATGKDINSLEVALGESARQLMASVPRSTRAVNTSADTATPLRSEVARSGLAAQVKPEPNETVDTVVGGSTAQVHPGRPAETKAGYVVEGNPQKISNVDVVEPSQGGLDSNRSVSKQPSSSDEKEVLHILEQYANALENRDRDGIAALVSRNYLETGSTEDTDVDDYGFERLTNEVLPKLIANVKAMRLNYRVSDIQVNSNRASITYYYTMSFLYSEGGRDGWHTKNDLNTMQLERADGTWKIISGL
jgi:hypothetical protein